MRHKDADFYQRKAAMADLIERVGGPTRAGKLLGISQQMVSRVKDREDQSMLTSDGKLALECECGEPALTRVEAELLGYRLEPLAVLPSTQRDPFDAHAALVGEVGELLGNFAARVRDGDFSRGDGAAIDRDLADVITKAKQWRRLIAEHAAATAPNPAGGRA